MYNVHRGIVEAAFVVFIVYIGVQLLFRVCTLLDI